MTEILHLNYESDFTDSSGYGHNFSTHGAAQITATNPITGSSSGLFNAATEDYLTLTGTLTAFVLGTNNFTLQTQVNLTSIETLQDTDFFYFQWQNSNNLSVRLYLLYDTELRAECFNSNNDYCQILTGYYFSQLNTNVTLTLERFGDTLYLYVDNNLVGTTAINFSLSDTIGLVRLGLNLNGRMDETIVNNGEALITGANICNLFTVGDAVEINLTNTDAIIINGFLPDTREYEIPINSFTVTSITSSYLGNEIVEPLDMGLQINSQYSYEVYIPPNWISRVFTAKLGDLVLPISSISASLSASGGSNLTLEVQGVTLDLLDQISTRTNDPLIVTRTYRYNDTSTKSREFIRVNYETVASDQGARSGTVTLSGRKYLPVSQSKDVLVPNGYVRSMSQGRLRYRLPIYDEINLGDVLHIDNSVFTVGKITYYISVNSEFMECQEYIADGTDSTGIGANIRQTPLQEYIVLETNINYFLWQEQGYLYNGRAMNPADTTNYPYSLWYDSTGLLWYKAGFPVYESDNITQASINV